MTIAQEAEELQPLGIEDDIDDDLDDDMPKVDEATNVRQFMLGNAFNQEFADWKKKIEQEESGTLVITHEEIIAQGTHVLIFWRTVPNKTVAKGRRG